MTRELLPALLPITLFLCGDVMAGRGIDQVLPYPSGPRIYEPYITDARGYVKLAEQASGPIPKQVSFSYIWGDALAEIVHHAPVVRIINLETAVTGSGEFWPGKGINYRMNPANAPALLAAQINVVSLANNHTLDWGYAGLRETIETLREMDIQSVGAGRSRAEAEAPAIVETAFGVRIVVFAFAAETSGVPRSWAAEEDRTGVNLLRELSPSTIRSIREQVNQVKKPGDIVIASVHWGANWGYDVSDEEERFAHSLIDDAGVDLIHGHSSHHVKKIEVYRGKLVLYGCGDFLNDYEGIMGHEYYRGDLGLMYFPTVDPAAGKLLALQMTPTIVRHFRVHRAPLSDANWLADVLGREGRECGTRVTADGEGRLQLQWSE